MASQIRITRFGNCAYVRGCMPAPASIGGRYPRTAHTHLVSSGFVCMISIIGWKRTELVATVAIGTNRLVPWGERFCSRPCPPRLLPHFFCILCLSPFLSADRPGPKRTRTYPEFLGPDGAGQCRALAVRTMATVDYMDDSRAFKAIGDQGRPNFSKICCRARAHPPGLTSS